MSKKRTLTPDFLAALTAGAVSPDVAESVSRDDVESDSGDEQPELNNTATEGGEENVEVEANAGSDAGDGDEGEQGAEGSAPEAVTASPEVPSLVAHLRDELRESRKEVTTLSIEKSNLESQLSQLNSDLPGLTSIVRKSVEVMAIALGTKAVGLDSMSNAALCEYYSQLSSEMTKKFPVGGRAATTADVQEDAGLAVNNDSPARRAAVNSSSIK